MSALTTEKALLAGYWIASLVSSGVLENRGILLKPSSKILQSSERGNAVASELVKRLPNMFERVYGLTVKTSLIENGIFLTGEAIDEFLNDLKQWCKGLLDPHLFLELVRKNRLLATMTVTGITTLIGSTTPSHRHRSDDRPIVSLEFPGFNFLLVRDICRTFVAAGLWPDQVLWNHPSLHSRDNPFYPNWKKGMKLRIRWGDAINARLFDLEELVHYAKELLKGSWGEAPPCKEVSFNLDLSSVHKDIICEKGEIAEIAPDILSPVFHRYHICALLGCEYAPRNTLAKLLSKVSKVSQLVVPFPYPVKAIFPSSNLPIELEKVLDSWSDYEELYLRPDTVKRIALNGELPEELNDCVPFRSQANPWGYPADGLKQVVQSIVQKIAGVSKGNRPVKAGWKKISERGSWPKLKLLVPEYHLLPLGVLGGGHIGIVGCTNPHFQELIKFPYPDNNPYFISTEPVTREWLLAKRSEMSLNA